MPLLTREYLNHRFGAETVRLAYDTFKRLVVRQVPEKRRSRALIDGAWQHYGEAGDLFDAFTPDAQSVELSVVYKTSSFVFFFDGTRTTVEVGLPSATDVAYVVDFFDSAAPDTPGRHSVFVGHGRDPTWRSLSDFLASQPDLWVRTYENSIAAGVTAIELLEQLSTQVDFAVLVHTCDSELAGSSGAPSANVVHETGFFQGALGRHRTLMVREKGCPNFDNIAGLHEVNFEPEAIEEAFEQILQLIRSTMPAQP